MPKPLSACCISSQNRAGQAFGVSQSFSEPADPRLMSLLFLLLLLPSCRGAALGECCLATSLPFYSWPRVMLGRDRVLSSVAHMVSCI